MLNVSDGQTGIQTDGRTQLITEAASLFKNGLQNHFAMKDFLTLF